MPHSRAITAKKITAGRSFGTGASYISRSKPKTKLTKLKIAAIEKATHAAPSNKIIISLNIAISDKRQRLALGYQPVVGRQIQIKLQTRLHAFIDLVRDIFRKIRVHFFLAKLQVPRIIRRDLP